MSQIRSICVYCGSGPGADPAFAAGARAFGKILAQNKIRLVYGGGAIGLMGELATAVLDHGGNVTGIIPEFLKEREIALKRVQGRHAQSASAQAIMFGAPMRSRC
jgi:predicted Rossmann-fold nucleotide-binding protein